MSCPSPAGGFSCPLGHDIEAKAVGKTASTMEPVLNNLSNNIPMDISNNSFASVNLPPGISHIRVQSSIPRTTASEASAGVEYWKYPSPAMFWTAIDRKQQAAMAETELPSPVQGPLMMDNLRQTPEDINAVVHIHNIINEKVWEEIKRWELILHAKDYVQRPMSNTTGGGAESEFPVGSRPTLTRFVGRPGDYSPKALFNNYILGYSLPFDRHDWYIDRNGISVRYVIDFYGGAQSSQTSPEDGKSVAGADSIAPVSFYLDVRPEASVTGLFDRFKMFIYSRLVK